MAGIRSDDDAFVESSALRKLKFYHYFERPLKMNLTEFSFSFYNILSIIVPIDCQWSPWTLGSCSKTCGVGTRTNTRAKVMTEQNGGTCSGSATMTEPCNNGDCRTKFRLGIHYNIFPIMTYVMECSDWWSCFIWLFSVFRTSAPLLLVAYLGQEFESKYWNNTIRGLQ